MVVVVGEMQKLVAVFVAVEVVRKFVVVLVKVRVLRTKTRVLVLVGRRPELGHSESAMHTAQLLQPAEPSRTQSKITNCLLYAS
jgi:hypothetical protein